MCPFVRRLAPIQKFRLNYGVWLLKKGKVNLINFQQKGGEVSRRKEIYYIYHNISRKGKAYLEEERRLIISQGEVRFTL